MKIVHLIMTGGYSEGWSYQDSVLVKEHSKKHEVSVITSMYERQKDQMVRVSEHEYISPLGICVYRLDYQFGFLPEKIKKVIRCYDGIYELLVKIRPEVIFSHNIQYFGTTDIAKYIKKNPKVRLYVDNHADFSNINNSWISKNILHKIIWKHCAKILIPYTNIFWGVLPARVEFLKCIYGTPKDKTKYLPLGLEDDKSIEAEKKVKDGTIRKKYNIDKNDFLIVTGGKIDRFKRQTVLLMEAIRRIGLPNVKLIVYGSVYKDIKEEFDSYVDNASIYYVGWISSDDTYDYIAAADIVVYPGRHSVLWEQTVGQGKPLVCKYWEGTTHVDIGGNVEFLYEDSVEEIERTLRNIIQDKGKYEAMLKAARGENRKKFLYSEIADYCIEEY